ncbi:MAG: acetyl-CoA carboxylase biotin carboxyl carrier protein [Oscillospiraceae bacterium]|jgi:acetyl-CoA carboxylase biotin carboxyl carrier protein|nr:acetyl-CoA carboxylase biotin carboxyl carrier protein [Oscillospiraceae bacterium]
MDKADIRRLAELMRETGLTSLQYTEGDTSIKLTRRAAARDAAGGAACAGRMSDTPDSSGAPPDDDGERAGAVTVRSPMVGIFYSAPGEGETPYVALGGAVRAGDTLCIIEAMKMMNEITAEHDGVVVEICASNKQTVDYGHPLFRIRPGEYEA